MGNTLILLSYEDCQIKRESFTRCKTYNTKNGVAKEMGD